MSTGRWLFMMAVGATTAVVLVALKAPAVLAGLVALACAVLVLWRIGGWWRRAYVVTVVAMFLGASHLPALAPLAGVLKIGALGLLALATVTSVRGPGSYRNRLHKVILGALWVTAGVAGASAIWAVMPVQAMVNMVSFAMFVFILHRVSTVRWSDPRVTAGDLTAGYWASTAMLAVGGVMAALRIGESVSTFSGRYQGILNNPNLLGMVAALTLALGVGVAIHRRSPLVWVSLLVPASQLLLSQSRTAMLATALGLVWAVLRGGVGRTVAVGGVALVVGLVVLALGVNPLGDSLERFGSREGGDVLNTRTLAWLDVAQYVQQNPLGIGWASTAEALSDLNAAGITSGLSSVHNSYLQLAFELGVVGAVLAVILLALLVVTAVRADASGIGCGLVAVIVAGLTIQVAESAIFGVGQPYPYLFWFAVLAASTSIHPTPERQRGPRRARFFTVEPRTGKVRAIR